MEERLTKNSGGESPPQKGRKMALYVHYSGNTGLDSNAARREADQVGHVLMTIGVAEISRKTMSEILFRIRYLDFVYGSSFLRNDPSNFEISQLLEKHIGLRIEVTNRGLNASITRRRFMNRCLDTIEEKVLDKARL